MRDVFSLMRGMNPHESIPSNKENGFRTLDTAISDIDRYAQDAEVVVLERFYIVCID
jgi:hypothetical protein